MIDRLSGLHQIEAMKIEILKISDLSFDPSNARKHGDKNLAAIVGSLRKFGQQKPIVIDKNNVVIAGNGTMAAAQKLGWTEIQCVRTELTGPEAMAFALADNRTAELAEWDMNILEESLKSLEDSDFDIGEIGFDMGDLFGEDKEDSKEYPVDDPSVEVSPEIQQGDYYMVVLFDGQESFNKVADEFNLTKFKANISTKNHPAFLTYGKARFIDGSKFLEKLDSK